jgi:CHAD domain-containing protein
MHSHEFVVPDSLTLQDVKKRLMDHDPPLTESNTQTYTQTWLDSFDWRVYQAGGLVVMESGDGPQRIAWFDLNSRVFLHPRNIDRLPGFSRELPMGALREALAEALEMRTLLPLVRVRNRVTVLRLLNDDEKTVLLLALEESRYLAVDGEQEGMLAPRVRLLPVKGYQKPPREMTHRLHELGLQSAHTPRVLEALAALGRRPGDYSSKLDYRLDPEQRADKATRQILSGLLETLAANIDGVISNRDSEFLHDLRVATRRTRSALSQIKGVLDPKSVEGYKAGFAWLQQVTGPVRDLDVYLLSFDDYRQSLPEAMRPHLEPMREFLTAHYGGEHKKLVRHLKSSRFRNLIGGWRDFLQTPASQCSAAPNASQSVKVVADWRIRKMYRRVRKEGLAIRPDSPSEDLHELRKSCKKLRYLMEFFQSLYPKDAIRGRIKIIKVLLDNLGNFQDLAVQAESLRHMARQMAEEGSATTDALLAMGILVGDLLNRQHQARQHFAEIFAEFDRKHNRRLFQDLFSAPAKVDQTP